MANEAAGLKIRVAACCIFPLLACFCFFSETVQTVRTSKLSLTCVPTESRTFCPGYVPVRQRMHQSCFSFCSATFEIVVPPQLGTYGSEPNTGLDYVEPVLTSKLPDEIQIRWPRAVESGKSSLETYFSLCSAVATRLSGSGRASASGRLLTRTLTVSTSPGSARLLRCAPVGGFRPEPSRTRYSAGI